MRRIVLCWRTRQDHDGRTRKLRRRFARRFGRRPGGASRRTGGPACAGTKGSGTLSALWFPQHPPFAHGWNQRQTIAAIWPEGLPLPRLPRSISCLAQPDGQLTWRGRSRRHLWGCSKGASAGSESRRGRHKCPRHILTLQAYPESRGSPWATRISRPESPHSRAHFQW